MLHLFTYELGIISATCRILHSTLAKNKSFDMIQLKNLSNTIDSYQMQIDSFEEELNTEQFTFYKDVEKDLIKLIVDLSGHKFATCLELLEKIDSDIFNTVNNY